MIGFRPIAAEPSRAVFELDTDLEQHANPMGTVHGGITCDLADAAMGFAYASTPKEGETFTTLELKINFLRPVWQTRLSAMANIVQRGHTIGLVECDVADAEGRLVARAASTCMTLRNNTMVSQLSTRLQPPLGAHDHVRGPRWAVISLVEYGDFECPYCRAAVDIVNALQQALGDQLSFTFRHFPMREVHPHAQHAAEVAEAAAAKGHFREMHDRMFAGQEALDDQSLVRYARELNLDAEAVAQGLA